MATPQENLDNAYPLAIEGSAVLDEESGDYWVKESGVWTLVGPLLGESINIEGQDVPYSEITEIDASIKIGMNLKSYPYGLVPVVTEVYIVCPYISVFGNRVLLIQMNLGFININAHAPEITNGGGYVFPPTSSIAIVPFDLQEIISSLVVPTRSISIIAGTPGTQGQVLLPSARQITLGAGIANIEVIPYVEATTLSITAYVPSSVGSFAEIQTSTFQLIAHTPLFESNIPTTVITLFRAIPRIQTAVRIQQPTLLIIIAHAPDDGSGIIVSSSIVSIQPGIPTIDAYPNVNMDQMWGEVTVTYNQPEDIFNGLSVDVVPVVSIFDHNSLQGIVNPNTTTPVNSPWNGEKSIVQKKFGKYSGRFYRTDIVGGSGTSANNNVILNLPDPIISVQEYPWIQSASITPDYTTYTPGGLYRGNRDFSIELWVYPLAESFNGTAETSATPLISDVFDQSTTVIYRLWDLHFRGSGTVGTVYARMNDQNTSTNPVAVVVSVESTNNFTANQWNHVVLMRSGNEIGIAVNGIWGTRVAYTGDLSSFGQEQALLNSPLTFSGIRYTTKFLGRFRLAGRSGGFTGDSNRFSGYMDQIRWIKGRSAYTFTNFSPPDQPFNATIHKKVENNITYYPVTSFYDQNMWRWWWAVENTYDSLTLEEGIKLAINRFILGCKRDEIWYSFTDCYVFIGPNTLNGVLKIALYGANPDEWHIDYSTGTGFVSSDYNRETGLKGDGVSKWIRTSRVNNTFPATNHHRAAWVSQPGTGPIFAGGISQAGSTYVDWIPGYGGIRHGFNTNTRTLSGEDAINSAGGFVGFSRNNSESYDFIVPGESGTVYQPAQTPWLEPVEILGASIDQLNNYQTVSRGSHRLAFYSHGGSLDLNKLKRRVQLLVEEIQQAIV